uniref:Uncharacterized protein n=1 Tax=Physcomitrium patens TaxID=3218 RepID=A0A2K1K6A0_PHYPA|nr:hypothetical protein PHYPA_011201 [Physcomitrium patens]
MGGQGDGGPTNWDPTGTLNNGSQRPQRGGPHRGTWYQSPRTFRHVWMSRGITKRQRGV